MSATLHLLLAQTCPTVTCTDATHAYTDACHVQAGVLHTLQGTVNAALTAGRLVRHHVVLPSAIGAAAPYAAAVHWSACHNVMMMLKVNDALQIAGAPTADASPKLCIKGRMQRAHRHFADAAD